MINVAYEVVTHVAFAVQLVVKIGLALRVQFLGVDFGRVR